MRTYNQLFKTFILLICMISITIFSCKKENVVTETDLNPKELYIALTGATNQNNTSIQNVLKAPDMTLQDTFKILHLRASNISDEEIAADIIVDPTLVEKYNTENNTSYKAMPAEAMNISEVTLTIPPGNTISNPIEVQLEDQSIFGKLEADELLLAYKVKDIKSPKDAKVTLSNEVYVVFRNVGNLEVSLISGTSNASIANLSFLRAPDANNYPGKAISVLGNLNFVSSVERSITVVQDNSLITTYNSANGTSLEALPSNYIKINNNNPIKIAKGTQSIAIPIEFNEMSLNSLTQERYIIPLKLTEEKAAYINKNQEVLYIVLSREENNIDARNSGLQGTKANRALWNVTSSSHYTTEYADFVAVSAIGKGSVSEVYGWLSDRTSTINHNFTVDMGASNTIKGFELTPQMFFGARYNVALMTVTSSDNGTNWTNVGVFRGTATEEQLNSKVPQQVKFLVPVKARYYRFHITGHYSNYYGQDNTYLRGATGIGDIQAIQ